MPELTISRGLTLLASGQYKDLHAKAIQAIKSDIGDPVPYFLLGAIALEHKNFGKAIELLSKAETLDPTRAIYPAYQAKTLSILRRADYAKQVADRAACLIITDAHIFDMLGVVYSRTGFHDLAIPMFKEAVSRDVKQANYHYNLGASAQFLGDFETAKTAYLQCLEIDQDFYRAWASLVSLDKQTPKQNHLKDLQSLFDRLSDNENASHQIGHAIAKTLEDMGRHEDSFDWLLKAKQKKREQFRYNRKAGAATFEAAMNTAAGLSRFENASHDTPIFIVGMPRTGTTLLDRILSSHSQVISAGELNVFAELIKSETGTPSNLVLDAQTFQAAKSVDLAKVGHQYTEKTRERAGGMPYMVDKMPLNFFYAGLIHRALPNARIIALRRGAMDACLSNFRQLLSVQESFYNYTFDIKDTAFFYRQFDTLMAHWRTALPKDRFMEIHYENVVLDQENETKRLLDFCGLPWEEACMRFHENAAPVSTASSVQVRQPLYSGSIGRWKKYGDKLDNLKDALGELAD